MTESRAKIWDQSHAFKPPHLPLPTPPPPPPKKKSTALIFIMPTFSL